MGPQPFPEISIHWFQCYLVMDELYTLQTAGVCVKFLNNSCAKESLQIGPGTTERKLDKKLLP